MNKQTIIGIVLIIAIFIGFNYLNRPSKEQLAERQRINDSIRNSQAEQEQQGIAQELPLKVDTISDSLRRAQLGLFAAAQSGDSTPVEVETDVLRLRFSPRGGFVEYAELKGYKTYDGKPLVLFEGDAESSLDILLQTSDSRVLSTREMFFVPQPIVKDSTNTIVTLRLQPAADSYIDFIYRIAKSSYRIDFDIAAHNMQSYLAPMTNKLDFAWQTTIRRQENSRKTENRYATLNYMYTDNDIERLSETKNDMKSSSTPTMWFAAKDHFFSTILLNKNNFPTATFKSDIVDDETSPYLKHFTVNSTIDFDPTGAKTTAMQMFFVPNQYKTLSSFNDESVDKAHRPNLQELIPLGWALFRWVNKYAIIPLFNLFGSFLSSWGLIILIVTIIIKVVLLPLTFKSYMSSAKMRVLKPQVDAINERIPADKMMERQQAQMQLYRSVGVSPMGGCLPMLLQMPILVAVFMYLPSAIELRQQSFLWASDLSTFDTVPFLTWNVSIPLIGRHISLFCLLMTITNIIYTRINMATTPGANQQMAMMKWMMYLMPLMFFYIFNEYASGLTYYYFISLLLTVLQTYLFRLFVDDDKLLRKLELAKQTKKPAKKSGFMARLEEAQKMQQRRLREQQKAQRNNRK